MSVVFKKKVFNFFLNLRKLNLFSSSKTISPLYPVYLVRLRMKFLNLLYINSPFRKRLYSSFPELQSFFEELDKNGVLIIPDFLSPTKYENLFKSLSLQLKISQPIKSCDQTTYKIVKSPSYSEFKGTELNKKFEIIKILISYVEGFWISEKRLGPILQSTKENSQEGGENCKPHVDCFQPSAKGFIYLSDVDKNANPFTYIPKTHIRDASRSLIEELGHRSKTKLKGSWRSDELNLNYKEHFKCLGLKGTLVIANVSGFHYRYSSIGNNNDFRNILYFAGGSNRDNPFLKLLFTYFQI